MSIRLAPFGAPFPRPAFFGLALLGLLVSAGFAGAQDIPSKVSPELWDELGLSTVPRDLAPQPATPPLPDPATYPVQLVLDDDGAEGAFGLTGAAARPFLWLNSFTVFEPVLLREIWVLFPAEPDVAVGREVELAVWSDPDGDPRTGGATLLATYDVTIQADDGDTFSIYPIDPALWIPDSGDVLIGVVNRYFEPGVDPPPTHPAAYDSTTSQMRSYFALWPSDPPDPPEFATASVVGAFDGSAGGNFMIRAFGGPAPVIGVPTLGREGLAAVILALALAGAALLQRRVG